VYDYYGKIAWQFLDIRLITTLETIRDRINKKIFINNWQVHGEYDERGLRCYKCNIVKYKMLDYKMYMSAHLLGKAADFEVEGLISEEVRQWIVKNKNWWPYSIRLEKDTPHVHLDLFDSFDPEREKVYLFNK
jgi:hypothetical protein